MSGPLPKFLLPLTIPASWIYGAAMKRRNRRFDRGIGVEKIDRPVVSFGNITTGGTGKTPMVMWAASMLCEAGHKPVIAMRGYKAVNGISDEAAEYADRLPGVPVLANPHRIAALREFLPQNEHIDCVLLDDGFQHRQLHRDLDLVLIDSTADTFHDRLLPAGNLREPLKNLKRADGLIRTHADSGSHNHNLGALSWLAASRHTWKSFDVHHDQSTRRSQSIDWLRGKRILTMLGVGNPQSIIAHIEALGGNVAANIPCADHERFDRTKVAVARGLVSGCDAMLVTHKDWVKLRHLIDWSAWPVPIVVPRLEIEFTEGELRLRELILSVL